MHKKPKIASNTTKQSHREKKVYCIVTQRMCITTEQQWNFNWRSNPFVSTVQNREMHSAFFPLVKLHSACASKEHIGASRGNKNSTLNKM